MDLENIHKALEASKKFRPYEQLYSTHAYIMFVINSILFIFCIYYIHNWKVALKFEFKSIAFHAIIVCWLLVGNLMLGQPVSLPPLFAGYSLGPIKNLGPDVLFAQFCFSWACIIQMGVVITMCTLLQYSRLQIVNSNIIVKLLKEASNDSKIRNFLLIVFLFHILLIVCPTTISRINMGDLDYIEEVREFRKSYPSLLILVTEKSLLMTLSFIVFALVIVFELTLALVANLYTLKTIRQTSKFVNRKTLRMQMAVFKLISLQSLMIFLFFYLPILFAALGKLNLIDQVFITPISNAVMMWFWPISFLISLTQFPQIHQLFSTNSNTVKPATNITLAGTS